MTKPTLVELWRAKAEELRATSTGMHNPMASPNAAAAMVYERCAEELTRSKMLGAWRDETPQERTALALERIADAMERREAAQEHDMRDVFDKLSELLIARKA